MLCLGEITIMVSFAVMDHIHQGSSKSQQDVLRYFENKMSLCLPEGTVNQAVVRFGKTFVQTDISQELEDGLP